MFKFNQANVVYSPKVIGCLLQAPATVNRAATVNCLITPRLIDRHPISTDTLPTGHVPSKVIASTSRSFLPAQGKETPTLKRILAPQRPVLELRSHCLARARMADEPTIHTLYERRTGTWQYVVSDPSTKAAVIVDPVLDYDSTTQIITTDTADSILSLAKQKGLRVERILETHVHADHITAASYLQNRLSREQDHEPLVCIGKRIVHVQELFGQRYQIPAEEYKGVFDKLLDDDETFSLGKLTVTALHLPGHTPDHMGYMIGDNVFCGDSVLNPDFGTARADFPGGSVSDLFHSGRKLLSLPEHVRIWTGHDYLTEEREEAVPFMSVRDHREGNKHLRDGLTEKDFVALRTQRDATLPAPKLLHPSLQINIRAGRLPRPTALGERGLHLPLKLGGIEW
ncbi:putative metallo-beta-lactamase domain protein, partial [Aureobasidium melanogenum]